MRIVALDAIHPAFEHGVMVREIELGVGFKVAIQAGGRVLAGIQNEFSPTAADFDVFTAGAVTGFASARTRFDIWCEMQAGVRAGGKWAGIVRVAGEAGLVAGVMSPGDFSGNEDLSRCGATGVEQRERGAAQAEGQEAQAAAKHGLGKKHRLLQSWRMGFDQR